MPVSTSTVESVVLLRDRGIGLTSHQDAVVSTGWTEVGFAVDKPVLIEVGLALNGTSAHNQSETVPVPISISPADDKSS